MAMKNFVSIASDDFDLMYRMFKAHEVIELCLNFDHSPSVGMVVFSRGRDPESVVQLAKGKGMRAGQFATEEGAKKALKRVLQF